MSMGIAAGASAAPENAGAANSIECVRDRLAEHLVILTNLRDRIGGPRPESLAEQPSSPGMVGTVDEIVNLVARCRDTTSDIVGLIGS